MEGIERGWMVEQYGRRMVVLTKPHQVDGHWFAVVSGSGQGKAASNGRRYAAAEVELLPTSKVYRPARPAMVYLGTVAEVQV